MSRRGFMAGVVVGVILAKVLSSKDARNYILSKTSYIKKTVAESTPKCEEIKKNVEEKIVKPVSKTVEEMTNVSFKFRSTEAARETLNVIKSRMYKNGFVSLRFVEDLYSPSYHKPEHLFWGWDDLSKAIIIERNNCCILRLPRPKRSEVTYDRSADAEYYIRQV